MVNLLEKPVLRNSPRRTRQGDNRDKFAAVPGVKTVLVMDAEPTARKILGEIIREQLGHRIVEACNLAEAQSLMSGRETIHVLLMDLSTFEADGCELSEWCRALYPETKILVTADFLWEVCFRLSATKHISFLPKPFTASRLATTIRQILD